MDNHNHYRNVSNIYSTFPSINLSTTGQIVSLPNDVDIHNTCIIDENNINMLPSPEYGNKVLNAPVAMTHFINMPHTVIPPQSFQEMKQQEVKSLNLQLKQENFGNDEESVVVIPQASFADDNRNLPKIDVNNYYNNNNNNQTICPPTPTTPNNENLTINGVWMGIQRNEFDSELNIIHHYPSSSIPTISCLNQIEVLNNQGQYLLHNANPRNPQAAFKCFVTTAELGSQKGKHQVAYCLQHGFGVPKNETKAVEIYMEIANSKSPLSASVCQLGICFQMGIGVQVDASRAIEYYECAIFMGNKDAMFNLAYCLRYGIGTAINNEKAYNLYLQLANLGDPQGMKFVGNCKAIGLGTNQNEKEAIEWYRYSSKSNIYWGGKVEYALILLNGDSGINVSENHHEAFKLLRSVCELFPMCPGPIKLLLGKCFHSAVGCEKDLTKALHWYQEAIKSHFMTSDSRQECQNLIVSIQYL